MSSLYRLYGWLIDRPGVVIRWLVLNALVIFLVGLMTALLDLSWGSPANRWGLTVWYCFVVGFSGVVILNILLGLLGLGYPGRREEGT